MTISEAYDFGFDSGLNGANEVNSNFRIFANPVLKKSWENGNKDGKKSKPKNENAVALGRLGGLKGGKARANKLSAERRKEIASIAANARWNNIK